MTSYTGNCSDRIEVGVQESLYQRLHHWLKIQTLKVEVYKERQQLRTMSDAMLSDLGITRAQADQEARRLDLPGVRIEALYNDVC